MKKLLIILCLLVTVPLAAEDEQTIAILNVIPKYVDQAKADIIYEFIIDRVNRTGNYVLVERSALNEALSELKISMSDLVDESTAVQIGKLAGARFVLVSSLILESEVYYLSMRVVSVETGKIFITSVKSTDDFARISELTSEAVEYLFDSGTSGLDPAETGGQLAGSESSAPEMVDPEPVEPREPGRKTGTALSLPPLRITAGGTAALPVLDDAELLGVGFGGTFGLDFKLLSSRVGEILLGIKLSGLYNGTKEPVTYQYHLLTVPVFVSLSYSFHNLAPVSLHAELDGGLAGNGYFYQQDYPDTADRFFFLPAVAPGLGVGFEFNEKLAAVLFCNYLIVFYDTYPLTGVVASLRMNMLL